MEYTLYTDGGARGNPGPAGAGWVIERDEEVVEKKGAYLGETTNNTAEYTALIMGLTSCDKLGARNVAVVSDSELMVKQLTGRYRVKNGNLKSLFEKVKTLEKRFDNVKYTHIKRAKNKEADRLVNEAIEKK